MRKHLYFYSYFSKLVQDFMFSLLSSICLLSYCLSPSWITRQLPHQIYSLVSEPQTPS